MICAPGSWAMYHAVARPTMTMNTANSTVLQRRILTRRASSMFCSPIRGNTKSRAKLVPRAFKAVLSEPIAVASSPAITSPHIPWGIRVRMKCGNTSRPVAGSAASGNAA